MSTQSRSRSFQVVHAGLLTRKSELCVPSYEGAAPEKGQGSEGHPDSWWHRAGQGRTVKWRAGLGGRGLCAWCVEGSGRGGRAVKGGSLPAKPWAGETGSEAGLGKRPVSLRGRRAEGHMDSAL